MFNTVIKSEIGEDISILVKIDNHSWNYICECGDANSLNIKEIQNSNAIFISYTHIDHFINFDTILRHQIGIQRRVVICGPENISKQIQAKIKGYTWNLINKDSIIYEIREVISNEEIKVFEIEPPYWELKEKEVIKNNILFKDKSFFVTCIVLNHSTPSIAYKFTEYDSIKIDLSDSGFQEGKWVRQLKVAFEKGLKNEDVLINEKNYKAKDLFHLLHVEKGDSFGVIMDHVANKENHSKIIDHFYKCRKVFIETFFKLEDKNLADKNFHSYSTMSGKIMREAKVKEAIPVHFSRKYDKKNILELKNEFTEVFHKK